MAQLCGMCLALRDDHGHAARVATNYDGLIVSALVEAQSVAGPTRRAAGACPLRGMRKLDVATGDCVRLAATVSLVLAAAKVRDHVEDHDGVVGQVGFRPAARAMAQRWARQGAETGVELGFDTAVLLDAVERQAQVETSAGLGSPLLVITEPTETATGAAFGHTAILAGRPGNVAALTEVGRLFGRVAHLLDAVEDLAEDAARGKWNPLTATGASVGEAHRLCKDAVLGIKLAMDEAEFTDGRLVHRLLEDELRRSVHRTFKPVDGHRKCSHDHGTLDHGAHDHDAHDSPDRTVNLLAEPTVFAKWGRRNYPPPGSYPPPGGYPPPGYGGYPQQGGYPPPGYGGYGPPPRRRGFCLPICEGIACCECIKCGDDCCCCACDGLECCGDGCCDVCDC
jgi:hypothetical protein